jgi:hypothetical protein
LARDVRLANDDDGAQLFFNLIATAATTTATTTTTTTPFSYLNPNHPRVVRARAHSKHRRDNGHQNALFVVVRATERSYVSLGFVCFVVGSRKAVRWLRDTRPPPPLFPPFSLFATGIVVTDLDASSDDDADIVDDAPKLPRSVLQALLLGPGALLLSPVLPQLASQSLDPPPLLDLDPGSLFELGLDEAMDVEQ